MSWEPEIEEIRRRRALAARMGGDEAVARQHAGGKLTVRERIDLLLDAGSFREIGSLAGKARYENGELVEFRPSNFVFGTGRVNGRRIVVGGDDFTVRGGAQDGAVGNKMGYAETMALELELPLVRLVDGTGGGGSVKTLESLGRTYVPAIPGLETSVELLSRVPVVGAAMAWAWMLIRLRPDVPPAGTVRFPAAFFWTTLLLVTVSGSLEAARDAVRRERQAALRKWLVVALTSATAFCGTQAYGIRILILSHRPDDTVLGLNAFVVALTAMHALHVSVAVLFLIFVTLQAWRGRYDHEYYFGVVVCAWFWHVLAAAWGFILLILLMGLPIPE